MLSNNTLIDLICERFDSDDMREAFLDEIAERIDYRELAEAIAEEHATEIDDLIASMAEDALR